MEYKISKVGFFSNETYGRDQNHRVMVSFDGLEKDYSAFVKEKPNVGDVWEGELKKVEKNDKIYHNFEFAKAAKADSSPASKDAGLAEIKNILMLKVIPLLEAIYKQNPPIQKETKYDVEKADDVSDSVPF